LEGRWLLAAVLDVAPDALPGAAIYVTISGGETSGVYAANASFELFANTGTEYFILSGNGSAPASSGTYAWTKSAPNAGTLEYVDSVVGAGSVRLTFDTPYAGDCIVTHGGDAENGTFWINPSIPFGVLTGDGNLAVIGTDYNDTIKIFPSNDMVIVAMDGAQETFPAALVTRLNVFGGAGADHIATRQLDVPQTINGGAGPDTISGGPLDDELIGGKGADSIASSGGNDTLIGGKGDNTLRAGGGHDQINTGPGNSAVYAINGYADTIYGGAGNDTAHVQQIDVIPDQDIKDILYS
jgi:Ca2+-binding RTX toxin-like protein